MTDVKRHLFDCLQVGACYAEGYAAGKDGPYPLVLANLNGSLQAEGCDFQVESACVKKVMAPMAKNWPTLFVLVETWVLEDNCNRD